MTPRPHQDPSTGSAWSDARLDDLREGMLVGSERIVRRFTKVDSRMGSRFKEMNGRMDSRFEEIHGQMLEKTPSAELPSIRGLGAC